jgi:NTP pyrophosphatase (non-canonical NTP hydrolase)
VFPGYNCVVCGGGWDVGDRIKRTQSGAYGHEACFVSADAPVNWVDALEVTEDAYRDITPVVRCVLNVAEEAGEFVGAYRRLCGWARRDGTGQEAAEELADVVIAAFSAGAALNLDLRGAILEKGLKVVGRFHEEGTGRAVPEHDIASS